MYWELFFYGVIVKSIGLVMKIHLVVGHTFERLMQTTVITLY